MNTMQTAESFWSRVDIRGEDECWPWTGSTNGSGYGKLGWGGNEHLSHRIAAWLSGLVESPAAPTNKQSDQFVLHQCDNKLCCNRRHFKVGTQAQNVQEAYDRGLRVSEHSKFTSEQVACIRALHALGARQSDLAAKYGVSRPLMSKLITRKTY
jgi:hypothetical protein